MVIVYKTSVETSQQIKTLQSTLDELAGKGNWNFALDDADRILRIVSPSIDPSLPVEMLKRLGFNCSELED